MNYPRLLFITSHAFNNVTGGGITFSNLFINWPPEKLLTIHNDNVEVAYDVCKNYYRLNNEIVRTFPFDLFKKKNCTNANNIDTDKSNIYLPNKKKKLITRIINYFLFGKSEIPDYFRKSEDLENVLNNYKPEVIYTILGSNGIMEFVKWAMERYKCKLVIHIMDDWYSIKYKIGLFSLVFRKKMKKLFNNLIKFADLRLAICSYMNEEYEKRFELQFKSFHNAIDTKKWSKVINRNKNHDSQNFIIRYIGSVLPFANVESLKDFVKTIDIINLSKKIILELYIPDSNYKYAKELVNYRNNIKVFSEIKDHEIFYKKISDCDLLILPTNFNKYSVKFLKYSMPTKVPAYMLSKTPILLYGSSRIAQIKYAMSEEWGYCVTERNIDKLKKAISELLVNKDLREKFINNAYELACKNHDIKHVSRAFQNEICSI